MTLPYPNISAAAAARTAVDVGAAANDHTGSPLRVAFTRSNARDAGLETAVDQAKANFDSLDSRATSLEGSAQFLNWRGDWATATAYVYTPGVRRDIFRDAATGDVYMVLQSHTSTSLAADEAGGKIAESSIAQVTADVSTLKASMLTAQGDITQLELDVAAAQLDVDTLAADLALDGAGKGANKVGVTDGPTTGAFSTVQGFVSLWAERQKSVDLRAGMDAIYGAGVWTERTGVGVGSDIGPALAHLMDNTPARTEIYIPPGTWRMVTPVATAKLSGRRIVGVGSQGSKIVYGAASGDVFHYSGSAGLTGGGVSGIGILLEEGLGDTAVNAIRLEGNSTEQADQMEFNDLYITALGALGAGASYWNSAFLAIGTARTAIKGIRVANLSNLQLFRCHGTGVFLQNVVQWTLENVGVYVSKGAGQNIYIAGGGSPSTNSEHVYARGLVAVELNITNALKFDVTGSFTTFATGASATNGRVFGFGTTLSGSLGTSVTFTAS